MRKSFPPALSISLFIVMVLVFASCAKQSGSSFPLDGAYVGVYQQTGSVNNSAYVRLVFAGNGYSGESTITDKTICPGNYEIIPDSIAFTNLCSIPPDQLLIYGNYRMTTSGDSLYFRRDSTGNTGYNVLFSLLKQ